MRLVLLRLLVVTLCAQLCGTGENGPEVMLKEGPGVCTKVSRIFETVSERVNEPKTDIIAVECTTYDNDKRMCTKRIQVDNWVTKTKVKITEVPVKECCQGYREEADACVPVCDPSCEHGECTAPQQCTCHEGYEKNDTWSNICYPVCSEPCHHSRCVRPNVCECNDGFKKNDSTKVCEPVCSKTCYKGYCSAPNTCSCNEGYKINVSDSYTCTPVCSPECVNAICTEPDVCICNEGYIKDEKANYVCKPNCSRGCSNGECVAPEVCSCHSGYEKTNDTSKCKPICSQECINSECVAPEECFCLSGYKQDSVLYHTCHPHCTRECINSNCTEPQTCNCLEGFKKDSERWNVCNPHCSKECIKGKCTRPEFCECLPGYQRVPEFGNKNLFQCSDECINAVCTSTENCTCLWGFTHDKDSPNCSPSKNLIVEWQFSLQFNDEHALPQKIKIPVFKEVLLLHGIIKKLKNESLSVLRCNLRPDKFSGNIENELICNMDPHNTMSRDAGTVLNFTMILDFLPYIKKEKITESWWHCVPAPTEELCLCPKDTDWDPAQSDVQFHFCDCDLQAREPAMHRGYKFILLGLVAAFALLFVVFVSVLIQRLRDHPFSVLAHWMTPRAHNPAYDQVPVSNLPDAESDSAVNEETTTL